jgi:hypothetical protein
MKFEEPIERRLTASEASNEIPTETPGARSDSSWGIRPMTEKLKEFGAEVKNTSPREAVHHVMGAVDRVATDAKHYVQNTTVPGFVDDVTELIRRYPVQSLIMGMTLGFLLFRKRANSDQRF